MHFSNICLVRTVTKLGGKTEGSWVSKRFHSCSEKGSVSSSNGKETQLSLQN